MKKLYLREATFEDVDLLFAWVNDPVARQSAFSTEKIEYDTHVKWFKNVLSSDDVKQLICMREEEPVGQIRINLYGEKAELDYSISAKNRKAGYGSQLISLGVDYIKSNCSEIRTIIAQVKKENIGSTKVLLNNGFEECVIEYALEV